MELKTRVYLEKIKNGIIFLYLFVMLGIFPIYYKKQYEGIGTLKFQLFYKATIGFLIAMAVILPLYHNGRLQEFLETLRPVSLLDKLVLGYGVCVLLSFLFSEYKDYAIKGAEGWNMGLLSQLFFLALYWLLSRYFSGGRWILYLHFLASGLVFLLGILHRFEIDPLQMYPGLNLTQKQQFLSTLGQATWYSSYVCTVFALGVFVFYLSKNWKQKLAAGVYAVLAFGTLVTQNSDSAFMAVLGIFLLLGWVSFGTIEKLWNFSLLGTLLFGTFYGMGILQKIFAERAIPLDSLSIFFSQSGFTVVCFYLFLCFTLFLWQVGGRKEAREQKRLLKILKGIYAVGFWMMAAGILLLIVFIILNTKGILFDWFGYESHHNYLYFDYEWGNRRGSSWILAWQGFSELTFLHKLFGVGPDSFAAYMYSVPELKELLTGIWGTRLTLTNAHNEYLNSLLCYGILGLGAWVGVLIGGIRYFLKQAKQEPFLTAFALCIMGYACHNIFCYQQVCCTPFLFLALGIGESICRNAISG